MRSSTSDFEPPGLLYAKLLAGICSIIIIALEFVSAHLLQRYSATYARVSEQYAKAVQVRPARSGEPTSVLMVGNSLLLDGVDVDRLQELIPARMQIYPIFLEATGYYDWLYGLRRLFRQGASPQVVVIGVGANYFLENGVRREYVPMMFFDARDVFGVASDLHLDRTATSDLLLAHASAFWDTRSVVRTQILARIVPHVKDLFLLADPRPVIPPGPDVEAKTILRLQSLRELCGAYGAKLIILVPPTLSSDTAVSEMANAARKVGVDMSVPIDPETFPAGFYQPDGLHLNSAGAALFTAAVAIDLPKKVAVNETAAWRN
jgi:hypothetical protein